MCLVLMMSSFNWLFNRKCKKKLFWFDWFIRFFFWRELYEVWICRNCELFCLFESGFLLSLTLVIFQNLIEILMVEFVEKYLEVLIWIWQLYLRIIIFILYLILCLKDLNFMNKVWKPLFFGCSYFLNQL